MGQKGEIPGLLTNRGREAAGWEGQGHGGAGMVSPGNWPNAGSKRGGERGEFQRKRQSERKRLGWRKEKKETERNL